MPSRHLMCLTLAAMLSGCGTLFDDPQTLQCNSTRRNVEAALTGFSEWKSGNWYQREGTRIWDLDALDNWDSCRLEDSGADSGSTLRCRLDFDRGEFRDALEGYKWAAQSLANCIRHGKVSSEHEYGSHVRTTSVTLDPSSEDKFIVQIALSLELHESSQGGGSTAMLTVVSKRHYFPTTGQ